MERVPLPRGQVQHRGREGDEWCLGGSRAEPFPWFLPGGSQGWAGASWQRVEEVGSLFTRPSLSQGRVWAEACAWGAGCRQHGVPLPVPAFSPRDWEHRPLTELGGGAEALLLLPAVPGPLPMAGGGLM